MATKPHNDATPENQEIDYPQGFELRSNLSPARLGKRPGGPEGEAGQLAVRGDRPVLCGWVTGTAWTYEEGESQYKDQQGKPIVFKRILGEFYALNYDREEITGSELFLPPVAERFVLTALKSGRGVPISFEFWAFPNPTAARLYEYRTFIRQPPGVISAAKRMAIAAGIIPAPEGYVPELAALEPPPLLQAITAEEGFDPETGEIAAEETRVKDGLDKLLEPRAAE